MNLKNGVIILYNLPQRANDSDFKESEGDVLDQVKDVSKALDLLNIHHKLVGVNYLSEVFLLKDYSEEVVFNLVESLGGEDHHENLVPWVLTSINKAFTGGIKRVSMDKWVTKLILEKNNIPCPKGILVNLNHDFDKFEFNGKKYIIKPAYTDGSEGIYPFSVVSSLDELKGAIQKLYGKIPPKIIIEEFIDGREINVAVFQDKENIQIMPIAEIVFLNYDSSKPKIVDYSAKWHEDSFEYKNTQRKIPADLPDVVSSKINHLIKSILGIIDFSGYLRVDLRLDNDLNPFVLEVNLNPDIASNAGFSAAIDRAGVNYSDFVFKLLESAIYEFHRKNGVRVRLSLKKDKDVILDLLRTTNFFKENEILIAQEVLDDAFLNGPQGHYKSYVVEVSSKVVGWICFGETPCAIGTYDIYWLAVSPKFQNKGIGKLLLKHAEEDILYNNGRLVVIETCGSDKYHNTKKFYEKNNYLMEARVKDFYNSGEDKIIYSKFL